MADMEQFVKACYNDSVDVVERMISEGVDVNGRNNNGCPALCWAMFNNSVRTVRLLLASSNIRLDNRDSNHGKTGLHYACEKDNTECVRMFLAHPACTREVVTIRDYRGHQAKTLHAEYKESTGLVKEYLNNQTAFPISQPSSFVPTAASSSTQPSASSSTQPSAPSSTQPPAPSSTNLNLASSSPGQSSLIPECPVCMEELRPPLQIYNCGNGHLICSFCRPRVTTGMCHCRSMYCGRATAMEQIIRQILNIE